MSTLSRSIFVLMALLVVSTSSLTAAYQSDYRYGTQYPPYTGGRAYQPQGGPGYGQGNAYGWPCYHPHPYGKFRFHADWLYWRACTDGQAVALSTRKLGKVSPLADGGKDDIGLEALAYNVLHTSEKIKFPSDDWESGFTIGFHFEPNCTCYDIGLSWTNFEPSNSSSVRAGEGKTLIPFPGYCLEQELAVEFGRNAFIEKGKEIPFFDFFVPFFATLEGDRVRSKWELCLNLLDLDVGFPLCHSSCFDFRPHLGLRYASIEQSLRVKTEGRITAPVEQPSNTGSPNEFCADFRSRKHFRTCFDGVGPRTGFDSAIHVGCGLSLYGNFAVSLLYGDRDARHRECALRANTAGRGNAALNSGNFQFKRKNNRRCSSFITDSKVGLEWSKSCCYCYQNFDFTAKIGWEHHYFFNQSVVDAAKNNALFHEERVDLSTNGLVLGLGVGF